MSNGIVAEEIKPNIDPSFLFAAQYSQVTGSPIVKFFFVTFYAQKIKHSSKSKIKAAKSILKSPAPQLFFQICCCSFSETSSDVNNNVNKEGLKNEEQ